MSGVERAIFWFRRDLRLVDNTALARCLREAAQVQPVFVFDTAILDELPAFDRRVDFIRRCLIELDAALAQHGGGLRVVHGSPLEHIPALAREFGASAVYANEDYEPAAMSRDAEVAARLAAHGIDFVLDKDHVLFARDDILTQKGTPYTVFTPYFKAWMARLTQNAVVALGPARPLAGRFLEPRGTGVPALAAIGFETTDLDALGVQAGREAALRRLNDFLADDIGEYANRRELPGIRGTSHLGVYLRFGCLSVREAVGAARTHAAAHPAAAAGCATWLSEIAWRDFFCQVMYHHGYVVDAPFRREFSHIDWENDDTLFAAWCEGRTGYPIVDGAMRELVRTGFMHNRLRMVTASFLVKDLLIDWRRGERWFARHLLDYDLAANNGNWQWVASTGCDAQPYFRVFNPSRQSERFDANAAFIQASVPELSSVPARYLHEPWRHAARLAEHGVRLGHDYPEPVVEHAIRARRAIRTFELARRDAGASGRRV